MQTLYPPIKTFATKRLRVDDTHELYIEQCGNPNGQPVLILHSGPGAGCESYHRRFFDPALYHIILFDQRGAGRSTPHASIVNNTTAHLLDDIETIRETLNIERWHLFGGAWGSTLALLYATNYPHHVTGLILHRVFLARKKDIDWFYQQGANHFFPDHWQAFIKNIPLNERHDLVSAYAKRLNGNDELARMSAAKHWSLWQAQCSALQPHNDLIDRFNDPHFALSLATIESHYLKNQCFIEDNQLLATIGKLRHVPMFIIHGRYDMICPLDNAWQVHSHCPRSELVIIRDAGHSIKEPGIIDALILASKQLLSTEPSAG